MQLGISVTAATRDYLRALAAEMGIISVGGPLPGQGSISGLLTHLGLLVHDHGADAIARRLEGRE